MLCWNSSTAAGERPAKILVSPKVAQALEAAEKRPNVAHLARV
jgi:hypothetical protein